MRCLHVLTVCTGNVCRSPAAAVVLREAVAQAGLSDRIEVSSAGTSWEAEGMPMDPRTELALERAGYARPFEHTARALHLNELCRWDLALVMTAPQKQTLLRMIDQMPPGMTAPDVLLWGSFDPKQPVNAEDIDLEVPDPWYRGQKAFDRTVTRMQRAVPSMILHLRGRLERMEREGSDEDPSTEEARLD